MPRILLTQAIHPLAQAAMSDLGEVVVAPETSASTLRRLSVGAQVVVVRAQLPDDIFEAAPSLIGAVRHGAGVDMIPIEQATAHGVLVANVPGVNANAVAEHVLRSLLAMARRTAAVRQRLRSGGAGAWGAARVLADDGFELAGRRVGVVGFGYVGQAIARLCRALSMQVLASTRSPLAAASESLATRVSLDELLQRSDFVVLACPLTSETRGLIGELQFAQMRQGAMLVNVARGPVVNEAALVAALQSGRLAAAALDVFDIQPLPPEHVLWTMPQVLITPHVAGITQESMIAMGHGAARAVGELLAGRVPPNCINPQATAAFLQRAAAGPGQR